MPGPKGYISPSGWFDWLSRVPLDVRLELPGGVRTLCVHIAPGQDDGAGLHPKLTDAELARHVREASADLVVARHTHRPMDRPIDGVRVLNVGSVNNPQAGDRRACYSILEASEAGYTIEQFRVEYDYRSVIDAIRRSRHPTGEFIARHFLS